MEMDSSPEVIADDRDIFFLFEEKNCTCFWRSNTLSSCILQISKTLKMNHVLDPLTPKDQTTTGTGGSYLSSSSGGTSPTALMENDLIQMMDEDEEAMRRVRNKWEVKRNTGGFTIPSLNDVG